MISNDLAVGSFLEIINSYLWTGIISWIGWSDFPIATIKDGDGNEWEDVAKVDLKKAIITVRNGRRKVSYDVKYPILVEFRGHEGCEVLLIADQDGCWNSGGVVCHSRSVKWG